MGVRHRVEDPRHDGGRLSLDTWLGGGHDEATSHDTTIDGPVDRVWEALTTTDFGRSPVVAVLLFVRGIGRRTITLSEFSEREFAVLEESPPTRIVLGMAGRPHRSQVDRVTAQEFSDYRTPRSVRIVWAFELQGADGRTELSTTTLVRATDAPGLKAFRRYWWFVKPFSGMIRSAMLRRIKRVVERG